MRGPDQSQDQDGVGAVGEQCTASVLDGDRGRAGVIGRASADRPLSPEKNPKQVTGFNCPKFGYPTSDCGAFLTKDRSQVMSTDNLIEIARQADAILGDQHDGFEGFETQMRRALARPYPVGADAIEVLVEDIDAAMFVCGHELIRCWDDTGNLHYMVAEDPTAGRRPWAGSALPN